jgi:outer membrane lipoprotein SlyB
MVTFLRACRRAVGWGGGAAAALVLLSGCATSSHQAALAPAGGAAGGLRYATITAVRPVPSPAPASGGAILADLGLGGKTLASAPLAELLLRTDDGAVLSLVQPRAAEWVPGSRVLVLPGDRLTLVRPGYTPPAS